MNPGLKSAPLSLSQQPCLLSSSAASLKLTTDLSAFSNAFLFVSCLQVSGLSGIISRRSLPLGNSLVDVELIQCY